MCRLCVTNLAVFFISVRHTIQYAPRYLYINFCLLQHFIYRTFLGGNRDHMCRLADYIKRWMENLIINTYKCIPDPLQKCSFPLHLQKMHFPFELAKNALLFWKNQTAQVRFHNFLMGKM